MSDKMWAHVERFDGGVIRVFDGDREYGEPYRLAIPFRTVSDDPGVLELTGVTRAPTPDELRAIVGELRRHNITVVRTRRSGACPGCKVFH